MTGTRIDLDVADGVAWITLDGPKQRNALNPESAAELIAVCERIDDDDTVGATVITGTDPAFSSGADRAHLARLRSAAPDEVYEGLEAVYAAFVRFGELSTPTVAAINGAAVGAGMNLALAADIRVMSETAVLASGFAGIGLHPGGGHLHLLARAGGPPLAAALGVFAQSVDAARAVATGLAWSAVPPEQLRPTVDSLVAHLAADPPLARALAASLRRTAFDTAGWDRAVEVERARQMWSLPRRRTDQ
jgi:enoyl-CoA hydratase